MLDTTNVLERARQLQEDTVALRRQLHAQPELSFAEHKTAALLAAKLADLGYEVKTGVGKTGVVADLGSGPALAIRAELDAVPVGELNRAPYSSRVPGVSHACGHDANMACVLTAARILSERRPAGRIRIILQPAAEPSCDEDGRTGTACMIADGALQDVVAVLAVHIDTTLPAGQVGSIMQPAVVSTQPFEVIVSRPQNPLRQPEDFGIVWHAARLVQNICDAAICKPDHEQAISVDAISSSNPHAEADAVSVSIQGSIRAANKEARTKLMAALDRLCTESANEACECLLRYGVSNAALADSEIVAQTLQQTASALLGEANVVSLKRKTWTEDFGSFLEVVPGALILLGAQIPGHRHVAHSPTFDINESSLYIGAAVLADAACRLLERSQSVNS